MGDAVLYVLMGLTLVAIFGAQGLLMAAREHVRALHKDWYTALSAAGSSLRMGGPDDRARRRLLRPLLLGLLPPGPDRDPQLLALARKLRFAMLAVALGFGGIVLVIALRVHAAG
jgi:hypothetical protein